MVVLAAGLLVAASACVSRRDAAPTPLPRDNFSFKDLVSATPEPSPTPTASPDEKATGSSDPSDDASSGTSTAAQPADAPAPRVVCPSGRVSASITDTNVNDDGLSATGRRKWKVQTKGSATNGTSAVVRSIQLLVRFDDADGSESTVISQAFAPGSSVNWSATFSVRSDNEPGDAQVSVTGWDYADSSLSSCPT